MTGMKALRNSLALVAVVAAALVLTGCPSTPRRGGPPSVDRAEAMTRAGDHAAAAAIYERLATETTGADSVEFNLRARAPGSRQAVPPTPIASWHCCRKA